MFTRECDAIRDAILKPRDEWEAEQERIRVEEAWNAMHEEALVMNKMFDEQRAAKIEADHEMALLMNEKFDRDREEQRRLAEQAQREHEERIKGTSAFALCPSRWRPKKNSRRCPPSYRDGLSRWLSKPRRMKVVQHEGTNHQVAIAAFFIAGVHLQPN